MPYQVNFAMAMKSLLQRFAWGKKTSFSHHFDLNENQACHSSLDETFANRYMFIHCFWQPAGLQSELTPSETSLMHEQYTQTRNQQEDFICLLSSISSTLYLLYTYPWQSVSSNVVLPDCPGKNIWVPFAKANSLEEKIQCINLHCNHVQPWYLSSLQGIANLSTRMKALESRAIPVLTEWPLANLLSSKCLTHPNALTWTKRTTVPIMFRATTTSNNHKVCTAGNICLMWKLWNMATRLLKEKTKSAIVKSSQPVMVPFREQDLGGLKILEELSLE